MYVNNYFKLEYMFYCKSEYMILWLLLYHVNTFRAEEKLCMPFESFSLSNFISVSSWFKFTWSVWIYHRSLTYTNISNSNIVGWHWRVYKNGKSWKDFVPDLWTIYISPYIVITVMQLWSVYALTHLSKEQHKEHHTEDPKISHGCQNLID